MNHKILNKLERKFGRFAIPNLMMIVIFGMALVFLIDTFINPEYTFSARSSCFQGRTYWPGRSGGS